MQHALPYLVAGAALIALFVYAWSALKEFSPVNPHPSGRAAGADPAR